MLLKGFVSFCYVCYGEILKFWGGHEQGGFALAFTLTLQAFTGKYKKYS